MSRSHKNKMPEYKFYKKDIFPFNVARRGGTTVKSSGHTEYYGERHYRRKFREVRTRLKKSEQRLISPGYVSKVRGFETYW